MNTLAAERRNKTILTVVLSIISIIYVIPVLMVGAVGLGENGVAAGEGQVLVEELEAVGQGQEGANGDAWCCPLSPLSTSFRC